MKLPKFIKKIIQNSVPLSILFHRDFKKGQHYIFRDDNDNPFETQKMIVKILDVEKNWIKYINIDAKNQWLNYRTMEKDSFNMSYQLL